MQQLLIAIAMSGLLGCSGGGGEAEPVVRSLDPTPAETPEPSPPTPFAPTIGEAWTSAKVPAGIWQGLTAAEQRNVVGVVFPSGQAWFLYSVIGAPGRAGGVIRGTVQTTGSAWSMQGATMDDATYGARATINANGTWVPKQSLTGQTVVVAVPPDHERFPLYTEDAVTLTYRPQSTVPFDLRQDKGIYAGLIYPTEEVLFELREDGSISGLTSTGCEFSGAAAPDGPVAKGSITFHGFPCANRNDTVKGVIGVDRQSGTLYAAGFNAELDRSLVFIGRR